MSPLIAGESWNAPEHAQRLDRPGGYSGAHVFGFPAEVSQNPGDGLLRLRIVATNEHRRPDAAVLRVDHPGVAHGVECLDEPCRRKILLQAFHEGFVEVGEEP